MYIESKSDNSMSGFIQQIVRTLDGVKLGEVEGVSKDIL
jgi:hypothetical protein